MSSKLLHPFCVLGILSRDSDRDHILTQPKILEILERDYRLTITRKTFYRSITILQSNGYDIETYAENHKGYYLRERPFSEEQAVFFCTMLEGVNDLTESDKNKTRDAFLEFLSRPMSKEVLETLSKNTTGYGRNNTMKNLHVISRAIRRGSTITFDYIHYNIHKEEVYSEKPFADEEPRFIVVKESRYYLITSGGRHHSISHFRIDKMRNIKVTDHAMVSEFRYQYAYDYALKSIFMFSGSPVYCRLRAKKAKHNIYDLMIDEFSMSVRFEDYDSQWFDVIAECSPRGMVILAQKYLDAFYVVHPQPLRQQVAQALQTALASYTEGGQE